jgi:hypothetical protein
MAYVDAYSELEHFGDGQKPWCDLAFDLVEVEVVGKKPWFGKDGRLVRGVAKASTPRGEIGFAFETAPIGAWSPSKSGSFTAAWGKVAIRSIGEPTDRLLSEYEAWWELPASGAAAVDELWCQAVLLSETPDALVQRPSNIKLFFQGAGDADAVEEDIDEDSEPFDYGELYFNFDVPARRAQLREKDPDYREAVTGFLNGRIVAGAL